ncbi:MAG: divergent PAP2 family protein [Candidatus Omnitrophica bacterium]|nr:divergent PAP2 family protein [Candidatus Omnitrophota bacterium]MBU4589306.1 divergent PAP2 family protein [Candidatus Omnitrophota bacterium]
MYFFVEIGKNQIFLTVAMAWLFAQTVKVTIGVIREKRFNFKWFVGAGGMPSSHAATVSALATAVGLTFGFSSPFFAIAFFFAFITMFDAQGVRRQSGQQAEILNKIIEDIYLNKGINQKRLIAFLGHTPIQVFAGAALGVLVALFCYQ